MQFTIETELETDGRCIAEVLELPGVLKYGATRAKAVASAEALALRVLALARISKRTGLKPEDL